MMDKLICENGGGHKIAYVQPEYKFGLNVNDKDLICVRCGKILEKYRWNGRYLEVEEVE